MLLWAGNIGAGDVTYAIVGTGQTRCYDNNQEIPAPQPGQPFYGQDAQHPGPLPAYTDNGDGTVSDLHTGLMWVLARGAKVTWDAAAAGHDDWRMPKGEKFRAGACLNSITPILRVKATCRPAMTALHISRYQRWRPTLGIGRRHS